MIRNYYIHFTNTYVLFNNTKSVACLCLYAGTPINILW